MATTVACSGSLRRWNGCLPPDLNTAAKAGRMVAVGAAVTSRPPHGSRRALLTHRARPSGSGAGLLDVFVTPARVESGRINDPSRKYPGDVCVRSEADAEAWEKAFEVRDKPVAVSDVQIFGKKCVDMRVREAAVVMVNDHQPPLDFVQLAQWAAGFGLGLTLFHGWPEFVDQVLFWSALPKFVGANQAVGFIHQRLVAVEAAPQSVALWGQLTSAKS
jgi:SacI restriction endonuclease